MFESSPGFTKTRVAGVPLISIIGGIGFVYLLYVLYGGVTNPSVFGPLSGASLGFMIGVLVFSIVLYYGSVAYHKTKDVDITLAFKTIPPE